MFPPAGPPPGTPRNTRPDKQPDWTAGTKKSFELGQPQWNPPVINVPEIRDITGQVIVEAIQGKDVAESAKKAAELMDKKMEI